MLWSNPSCKAEHAAWMIFGIHSPVALHQHNHDNFHCCWRMACVKFSRASSPKSSSPKRRKPTTADADLPEWEAAVMYATVGRCILLVRLVANPSKSHSLTQNRSWYSLRGGSIPSSLTGKGTPSACMFSSKQSFSFPFMPPPWHHHVSPAAASLTAPRRCEVACFTKSVGAQAHQGQQSQNYEPEARFLRTSSHGTLLLWQVAKASVLNGRKTLI